MIEISLRGKIMFDTCINYILQIFNELQSDRSKNNCTKKKLLVYLMYPEF